MKEFIKRALCFSDVLHDYKIVEVLSDNAVKCKCCVCGKEVAYNHHLQVCIPWDDSVSEFYEHLNTKTKKEESDYVRMKRDYV